MPTLPAVCGARRPSEHPDTPTPSWTLNSTRTGPGVCLHSSLGCAGCLLALPIPPRPPQVSGGCEPLRSKFSCNTQANREPAAPRQSLLPEPPGSDPHSLKHPSLSAPAGPPHPFPPGRTGCVEEVDGRQSSGEGGSGWDRPPTHRTRMRRHPVSVCREWTSPCSDLVSTQLSCLHARSPGDTNASAPASCTRPPAPQPTQGSPIGRSTEPPARPASSPWPGCHGPGF